MMETKEIYKKLHQFVDEVSLGCKGIIDLNLLVEAADRLKAMDAQIYQHRGEIADLEKQLAEKQPEWISVEDRLPGADGRYISYNGEDIKIRSFDPVRQGSWIIGEVTHWMPLPEPPKPKELNKCKYRKKPIVVEAYQTDRTIVIPTLEGDMIAGRGDYIITGVDGEKYPCKPDIFEKTYEPYFEGEGGE